MWALIPEPFRRAALYAVGGALVVLAAIVWLHVHDANVRNDALTGYVHKSELVAANAKAAEQKRQADAAHAAINEYQRKLAAAQADSANAQRELEAEIEAYEKNIGADSRCVITDRDRDWLLGNAKPKA